MAQTKARKALPWAVVDASTTALTSALGLIVLSRLLEPKDFGVVALAQSIVLIAQMFAAAGIKEAIIRQRPTDLSYQDTGHWLATGLGVVAFLVCAAIGLVFHLDGNPAGLVLIVQATTLLLGGFSLYPEAVLTRKMRTGILARRTLLSKVLYAIVACGLALAGAGMWSIVAASVLQVAVSTAALWLSQPRFPRLRLERTHAGQILGYGWAISAENLLWAFIGRAFAIAVGAIHGFTVLGYVNLAMRTAEVFANLLTAVNSKFAMPLFAKVQETPERVREVFMKATELLNAAAAPIFIGLALTARDWVPLFLGEKWIPAVPLIQILAVSWAVMFARMLAGDCIRVIGKPRLLLPPAAIASVACLGAVFITSGMSMVAIMYAWAARLVVTVPTSVWLVRRHAGISVADQLKPLLRPLLGVVAMSAVILAARRFAPWAEMPTASFPRLCTDVVLGGAVYLGVEAVLLRKQLSSLLRRPPRDPAGAVGSSITPKAAAHEGGGSEVQ